jgi:hypothetical protein
MKDMGERPSLKHSLDRWPDKNGNYEPGNVRWANPIEQGNNTRSNICIEWGGERKTLSEWSRLFGKERCFIRRRKNRLNTLDPLVLFQGLAREGGDAS